MFKIEFTYISACLESNNKMPPNKGPLWDHFLSGEKQNGSHVRAHCHGCIEKEQPIECLGVGRTLTLRSS